MATLTLKNVPDKLLRRLRKRAAGERRSLNQAVIHMLEHILIASEEANDVKERAERQLDAWRTLAGRWRSDETAEEEIRRIYSARTRGRDVNL